MWSFMTPSRTLALLWLGWALSWLGAAWWSGST